MVNFRCMIDILITGFGPFADVAVNPSETLVTKLGAAGYTTLILPTEYERAPQILFDTLDRLCPQALLMFGYAQSAHHLRIERRALNYDRAEIPDNTGKIRRGIIQSDRANVLDARINMPAIIEELRCANISFDLSDNPGGFVCNHLYYLALARKTSEPRQILFAHIPDTITDDTLHAALALADIMVLKQNQAASV